MIYKKYKDKNLSLLGFGMMRLPLKDDKTIDQELTNKMVDLAIKNGVNYFDTAYFYLNSQSENATRIALEKYSRESYYLATKFPGHELKGDKYPQEVFENQLKNCGVEYFDFYLLHCIKDDNIDTYLDPKWGIVDYFLEQKRLGRIKHLGFSHHGSYENLKAFLEAVGDKIDFCQLQTNYVDWTLSQIKEKNDLLIQYNIPLWVMEPVRGGRIASFNDEITQKLKALRPNESIPSWAFRFVQGIDNVGMILSGMSALEQVEDNLKTFEDYKPLNEEEMKLLAEIVDFIKNDVPCTGCEYCMSHCPIGINIPELIKCYNKMRISVKQEQLDEIDKIDDSVKPHSCIGCGACSDICPQHIAVPKIMKAVSEIYNKNRN